MNKRFCSMVLTVFLGAQLAAPALVGADPVQVQVNSGGFFSSMAQKVVSQWSLENSLLDPAYQQCPLHWHTRNIAYLSMSIMAAYVTYRGLKWGLNKIGLVR